MTMPTRPAPPPPNGQMSRAPLSAALNKKSAPPRPPPPKVNAPAPAKKSISILSNLFGASKNSFKSSEQPSQTSFLEQRMPPKIPPPPMTKLKHQVLSDQHNITNEAQLINFDESPTWSPSTMKKSNTGSDCVSMDSFCSSTSSPNNLGSGTTSQTESGFEDDFNSSDFKSGATSRSSTFVSDPFECSSGNSYAVEKENKFQQTNIRNMKPVIQPKPSVSSFQKNDNSASNTDVFDDSLSNGKNLIKSTNLTMPTIIKPMTSKAKPSTNNIASHDFNFGFEKQYQQVNTSYEDYLPSLPMPTIPPPPPPCLAEGTDEDSCSYAIVMYDFESDVVEDLNIRANEKVYLLRQMNDEWMYGRNKRGCEGIFPICYVDIHVPLKTQAESTSSISNSSSVSPTVEGHPVRALYNFSAETKEDLTIKENETINVLYKINADWAYGSNTSGEYGQFPLSFIEIVPENLPVMP